jgi:hypothetical protein
LLAKDVNDNACCLNERVALETFASKLAPTGIAGTLAPADINKIGRLRPSIELRFSPFL